MTVPISKLSDPAVRALLTALNANDRAAFRAAPGVFDTSHETQVYRDQALLLRIPLD